MLSILNFLARPFVALTLSPQTRGSGTRPGGLTTQHVHAIGPDPDRILLVIDSASISDSPLSQELSLAGHLARHLSRATKRGADIVVLADGHLDAGTTRDALRDLDLAPFDAVVLFIGTSEAFSLRPARHWDVQLDQLLTEIAAHSFVELHTFVVAVPPVHALIDFPAALTAVTNSHALRMNATSARACARHPHASLIPFDPLASATFGRNSDEAYLEWASLIAPSLVALLGRSNVVPITAESAERAAG